MSRGNTVSDVQMAAADVRASADRIAEAGEAVRTSAHPTHVAQIAAAMTGSRSAAAARRVYTAWSTGASDWSRAAARQSANMAAAVTDTVARDAAVASSTQRIASRLEQAAR